MKHAVRLYCLACDESIFTMVEGEVDEGGLHTEDEFAVRWNDSHLRPQVEIL